ncbi:LysR family transcriptional regulator [Rhizobium sophoriradicis]|nr:LysR family transcriptional regulator [Rhizobium sophoriradicis]
MRTGSTAAEARRLDMTQSTVSRRVQYLEQKLGQPSPLRSWVPPSRHRQKRLRGHTHRGRRRQGRRHQGHCLCFEPGRILFEAMINSVPDPRPELRRQLLSMKVAE